MLDEDFLVLNSYLQSNTEFEENTEMYIIKKKIKLLAEQILINQEYAQKINEIKKEMVGLSNVKEGK